MQRRSDMITCAICLYCDFHTFLYYARRELSVTDSGIVVLVMTILVKSWRVKWCDVMFIPVYDTCLNPNRASRKQQDCTLKRKFHQNNQLPRRCMLVLFKRMCKEILINYRHLKHVPPPLVHMISKCSCISTLYIAS